MGKQAVKQAQLRSLVIIVTALALLAALWFSLFSWYQNQRTAILNSWVDLQMVIVQTAGRSAYHLLTIHLEQLEIPKEQVEQNVFQQFVEPIHLLGEGAAFIYNRNYLISDNRPGFPAEYRGKPIDDIFAIQQSRGAAHYDALVQGVRNATEGTGWYIWQPQTGVEYVSWTSIQFNGDTWTIGLSTPEAVIIEKSGLPEEFRRELIGLILLSALVIATAFMALWQQYKSLHRMEELERLAEERTQSLNQMNQQLLEDIALRQKAETDLLDSHRRFEGIINFLPDATFAINTKGQVIAWNRAIEEMTGIPAEEILGKGEYCYSLPFYGEPRPMLVDMVFQPYPDLEPYYLTFERQNHTVIGEAFVDGIQPTGAFVWAKATALYDVDGNISGAVESIRDVSRYRQNEQELKRNLGLLEGLNRVLSVLNSSLETPVILHAVCKELAQTLHLPQAGMALLDPSGEFLTVAAEYLHGESQTAIGAIIPIQGNPATEYVLHAREPLEIPNAQTDPRMAPVHDLMKKRNVISMLLVPIFIRNKVIGTLGLDSFEPHEFTVDELILARNAALAVGQSLENAELYTLVQKELEERKAIEAALREEEQRYRLLVQNQGEGVVTLDNTECFVFANPAAAQILGLSLEEIQGICLTEFLDLDRLNQIRSEIRSQSPGARISQEWDIYRMDGQRRNLIVTITPQYDNKRAYCGFNAVFRDNTERKRAEEELRYLSTHDILTSIFNRTFFQDELSRLEKSRKYPISIVMGDVDGMKETNDKYGHAAGDELLRGAALILQQAFRQEDVVARIGGDEFGILLPSADEKAAQNAILRVRQLIFAYNSTNPAHPIRLSLGSATGYRGEPLSEVMKRADKMMYLDKGKIV